MYLARATSQRAVNSQLKGAKEMSLFCSINMWQALTTVELLQGSQSPGVGTNTVRGSSAQGLDQRVTRSLLRAAFGSVSSYRYHTVMEGWEFCKHSLQPLIIQRLRWMLERSWLKSHQSHPWWQHRDLLPHHLRPPGCLTSRIRNQRGHKRSSVTCGTLLVTPFHRSAGGETQHTARHNIVEYLSGKEGILIPPQSPAI